MSAPLWILFDAVGTLLYPDPPVGEVYHAHARQFGSRLSVAVIEQRFHKALAAEPQNGPTSEEFERQRWRRIVARVIDDVEVSNSNDLFEQLWRHFGQAQSWRLFDDVPATIAELSRHGYRLGIASNFDSRLRKIANGHPALAVCAAIFVSSEVGYVKPHQRFFEAASQRLDVSPKDILLVGDDEANDVLGAIACGWQALHLDRNSPQSRAGVIRTIADLSTAVSLLRGSDDRASP